MSLVAPRNESPLRWPQPRGRGCQTVTTAASVVPKDIAPLPGLRRPLRQGRQPVATVIATPMTLEDVPSPLSEPRPQRGGRQPTVPVILQNELPHH